MAGDELLGWMAAGLTLVTFSMRSMIALRTVAVAANICFILYGTLDDLYPVLGLHLLLLPCNLFRICQLLSVAPSRGDRDAEASTVPTGLTKAAAPALAAEDAGTGRDSLITRTCELKAPAGAAARHRSPAHDRAGGAAVPFDRIPSGCRQATARRGH